VNDTKLEKSLFKYFTYHMFPDPRHVVLSMCVCVTCGGT